MTDPVLDEQEIISLLKFPVRPESVHRLQAGAMQALVDLYDRKCTREDFVSLAAPCVALYGQLAKFWMLGSVRATFDAGFLDEHQIQNAMRGMEDLIRAQAESVIEIVKRLQACPTSQDLVH